MRGSALSNTYPTQLFYFVLYATPGRSRFSLAWHKERSQKIELGTCLTRQTPARKAAPIPHFFLDFENLCGKPTSRWCLVRPPKETDVIHCGCARPPAQEEPAV